MTITAPNFRRVRFARQLFVKSASDTRSQTNTWTETQTDRQTDRQTDSRQFSKYDILLFLHKECQKMEISKQIS